MEECAARSRTVRFTVTPVRGRVYRRADVDPTTPKRPARGGVLSPESRGVAAAGFVYMIRIYRLGGSPAPRPAGAAPARRKRPV